MPAKHRSTRPAAYDGVKLRFLSAEELYIPVPPPKRRPSISKGDLDALVQRRIQSHLDAMVIGEGVQGEEPQDDDTAATITSDPHEAREGLQAGKVDDDDDEKDEVRVAAAVLAPPLPEDVDDAPAVATPVVVWRPPSEIRVARDLPSELLKGREVRRLSEAGIIGSALGKAKSQLSRLGSSAARRLRRVKRRKEGAVGEPEVPQHEASGVRRTSFQAPPGVLEILASEAAPPQTTYPRRSKPNSHHRVRHPHPFTTALGPPPLPKPKAATPSPSRFPLPSATSSVAETFWNEEQQAFERRRDYLRGELPNKIITKKFREWLDESPGIRKPLFIALMDGQAHPTEDSEEW